MIEIDTNQCMIKLNKLKSNSYRLIKYNFEL